MIVISTLHTPNIWAFEKYTVTDFDHVSGWITDEFGEQLYIKLDGPCDTIKGQRWYVIDSTEKTADAFVELLRKIHTLEQRLDFICKKSA